MNYNAKAGDPSQQRTPCLVLGVFSKRKLSDAAKAVDKASKGFLTSILKKGDMDGEPGQALMLYNLPGTLCERVLLIGCGTQKDYNRTTHSEAISKATSELNGGHTIEAIFCLPALKTTETDLYTQLRDAVIKSSEQTYRFDQCKSAPKAPKRPLKKLTLLVTDRKDLKTAQKAVTHGQAIANGISLAKDLGNLPGNICTPSYLADQARQVGRKSPKLKVKILEEKQMEALKMGALLSVSRGSRQPAKLITMEYRGGPAKSKPVVLVGKGLTFDAGGISIKPSPAMDEMKYDMCGGASVIATLSACVELKLPINVIGIVPASENLPDGAANKPGDIVTSMSGQTIEILNTDAEGRLILCDALTYCERFDPAIVIDVATLTGACVVALGSHAIGLLSNNDALADEILNAGSSCNDKAWRLPLWDEYQKQLDSNFADMANIGGKGGGTITAACFLSRYTKKQKWAHLDIAGAAWDSGAKKGSTGRPVSLLTQLLLKRSKQIN
ncbi:leucyl aminopeptidase [Pseudomonadota bacterium]